MPSPRIQDKFTDLPVSRQRKYQLRKKAAGLCVECGEPAVNAFLCAVHLVKSREYQRAKYKSGGRNKNSPSHRPPRSAYRPPPAPPPLPKPKPGIQDEFTYLPISDARKARLRKQRDAEWRAKYLASTIPIKP